MKDIPYPVGITNHDHNEALRLNGGLHAKANARKCLFEYLNRVDPDEHFDFDLLAVLCYWRRVQRERCEIID